MVLINLSIAGATQLNSSLLTISVIAVLLPAAFHFSVGSPSGDTTFTPQQEEHDILAVSHGVAIILLVSTSESLPEARLRHCD